MHGTRNLGMQGSLRCGSRDLVAKYPSESICSQCDPVDMTRASCTTRDFAARPPTRPTPSPFPDPALHAPESEARATTTDHRA